MKYIIILAFFLMLSACASTSTNIVDTPLKLQIKDILSTASGSGDAAIKNFFGSIFDLEQKHSGYNYYVARFNNINRVDFIKRINSICVNLNGFMTESSCEKLANRNIVLFSYTLEKGSYNQYARMYTSVLHFYESTSDSLLLTKHLETKGYISYRIRLERIANNERQIQLFQNRLSQYKNLSLTTRNEVIKTGARICNIEPLTKDLLLVGHTEEYVNGKIKIRIDDSLRWDKPNNWYLCE